MTSQNREKKKHTGLIAFLIFLLVGAASAGAVFYLNSQKIINVVQIYDSIAGTGNKAESSSSAVDQKTQAEVKGTELNRGSL